MPERLRQRALGPSHSGRAIVNTYVTRGGVAAPIELTYDVFGERGKPLVLVMGIGAQRMFWDEHLCELFVARGFQVLRFDHRDIGESTQLDAVVPKALPGLARRLINIHVEAPYTLSDMATDVVGLLDVLGWRDAHVVGTSLGGMIGQHMAIEHPTRVRTLTSLMSTPGSRRFIPSMRALRALFAAPPKNKAQGGQHLVDMFTVLGGSVWPLDVDRLRAVGELAFERGLNPRGFLRHFAAGLASGDRTARLRGVAVPTLVIHGSRDPMFAIGAGRAQAELVQRGTWLPIAGMGHELASPLWPTVVAAVARHAERAES